MFPAATVLITYDDCYTETLLDYNLLLNDCLFSELNENLIETKIDAPDKVGGSEKDGFLAAYWFPDTRMFYNLRQFSSKPERDFISANLCGFKNDIFFELGNDLF